MGGEGKTSYDIISVTLTCDPSSKANAMGKRVGDTFLKLSCTCDVEFVGIKKGIFVIIFSTNKSFIDQKYVERFFSEIFREFEVN